VAAWPAYAHGQQVVPDPPAISLFENLPQLENELLASVLEGQAVPSSLQFVSWEETGARVFLPMWEDMHNEHRSALQGITPQALPEWAGKLAELGQTMRVEGKAWLTNDEAAELAASTLSCALAVTLHRRGATVQALPGEAVRLQIGTAVIEPFNVVRQLAAGELTAEAWQQQCEAAGISKVDLGQFSVE
jgi:hypothetical protein